MKTKIPLLSLAVIGKLNILTSCGPQETKAPDAAEIKTVSGDLDRTVLPIKEPARQTYKELDARNAKAAQRWDVKAPAGAPKTQPGMVSVDDLADVGTDDGTPVTNYGITPHFSGKLDKVIIETHKADVAATDKKN